jgi:hypothetical protein
MENCGAEMQHPRHKDINATANMYLTLCLHHNLNTGLEEAK